MITFTSDFNQRLEIFGHLSALDELDQPMLSCEAKVVLLYIVFHLELPVTREGLEDDLGFDVLGALTELQQKGYLTCNS